MTRTGQCHCGSVQYEVQGELPYVAHCHCVNCRRSHGAAFYTAAFVKADNFEVTAGEEFLEVVPFRGDMPGGRVFCKKCGSRIFNKLHVMEGLINFPVAALNESPAALDAIHVNVESKVDWLELPEGAQQFAAFPPDLTE